MTSVPPAPWRLLFIEDSEDDFVLLVATLRAQGFDCLAQRVDQPAALQAALDQHTWQAVVADYHLPGFSALEALELLRARQLDLPFVVVSGAIGDDQAVAAMRAGAHDYLPKDQLARLGVSLAREIGEAEVRAEQRRLTASLDRALAEAELLNAIASTAAGQANLDQILAAALEHLRQVIAFTGGSIALLEGQSLTIRAAFGPFAAQALGQSLTRADGSRSWQVIDTGGPYLVDDTQAQGLTPTTPIRSYLAVPLVQRGQAIGLLELDSTEPGVFDPADVGLVQKVALRLSGPIELARRVAAERAARQAAEQAAHQAEATAERLRQLQALTAALSQAVTPEAVIDSAVRQGASALGTTAGGLSLVTPDGAWLETVSQVGYPAELARAFQRVPLEARTPGTDVVRSGQALWLGSEAEWAAYDQVAAGRAAAGSPYQAIAILPLVLAGQVAGIVAFSFAQPRSFDADDRAFLTAIVAQCAQALERARLYAAEREAAQAANLLVMTSAALAEGREAEAAVQRVVALVVPAQADVCLVDIAGPSGQLDGAFAEASGPWLEVLARVAATGQAHLESSASGAGMAHGALLHAYLAVPLTAHGQVLGVMAWATTAASGRPLDHRHLALAEQMAHRVALAVDNGRLYVELEARVAARTAQLHATNASLEREIVERTAAEAQLQRSRDQLRDLSARLQAVREDERTHIAYRVHDELGQQLAGLKMDLAWLGKRLGQAAPATLTAKLREMAALIDAMLQTVRLITTELRPGLLDDFGLAAAIEWQLSEFGARTNLATEFERGGEPALDTERATALFRIFQEALNNVAWHARATRVAVRLEQAGGQIVLSVRDNGRGLGPGALASPKSLGLLSMRERAQLLGGDVQIASAAGQGTQVLVTVPETAS